MSIRIVKKLPLATKSSNLRIQIPLVATAILLLWMVSGIFAKEADHSAAYAIAETKKTTKYQIINSKAQVRSVYRVFDGITKYDDGLELKSEIGGIVNKIYVKSGEYVRKGSRVLSIFLGNAAANVESSRIALEEAEQNYRTVESLFKKELASTYQKKEARRQMVDAKAGYLSMKQSAQQSIILAPFDGYIDHIMVSEGMYVTPNTSIAKFIDIDHLIVATNLPAQEAQMIKRDRDSELILENKTSIPVRVSFIAKTGTSDLPMYLLHGKFDNSKARLLINEAVKLRAYIGQFSLHAVPKTAICIGTDGSLAVKIVTKNGYLFEGQNNIEQSNNSPKVDRVDATSSNKRTDNSEGGSFSNKKKFGQKNNVKRSFRESIELCNITIVDEAENVFYVSGLSNEVRLVTSGVPYAALGSIS